MKIGEILRALADIADGQETTTPQQAKMQVVSVDNDGTGDGVLSPGKETMVPPLQQKLELLKKAAGVESMYDQEKTCCDQPECECDELNNIKRNAGLPVVVAHVAGEDNDVFQ